MRMRIDPRLSDLAGSGLVLLGLLMIAMALSAAPIVLRSVTTHGTSRPTVASPAARGTSLG
jgi:hypothetical protein